jgi:hypothetical protein
MSHGAGEGYILEMKKKKKNLNMLDLCIFQKSLVMKKEESYLRKFSEVIHISPPLAKLLGNTSCEKPQHDHNKIATNLRNNNLTFSLDYNHYVVIHLTPIVPC